MKRELALLFGGAANRRSGAINTARQIRRAVFIVVYWLVALPSGLVAEWGLALVAWLAVGTLRSMQA